MDSKIVGFNDYKVEIKKIRLRDANELFPFVASAMTKIGLGYYNYFNDLKQADIELFQKKLCENTLKITEEVKEDGTVMTVKKNLSLSDLDEYVAGFLPLLVLFLEFNFGFFTLGPVMLEPLASRDR